MTRSDVAERRETETRPQVRVTVCQLDATAADREWARLVEHVAEQRSDLVLLPEMPFAPWVGLSRERDDAVWAASVDAHDGWLARLGELGARTIVGSRPTRADRNAAFMWDEGMLVDVHEKSYLPDEDDFWEDSWYDRGDGRFGVARTRDLTLGALICTEMWFLEHARSYGRAGAQVIAVPRCTPAETFGKWLAGGRTCAVVAGAWCLSSNHAGERFGGGSWVIDPEGEVVGVTSAEQPFLSVDIALDAADAAKRTYPRYVPEL